MAATKASYDRCCITPRFFEDFYSTFLARCPQARAMFARTDFERQHKLLRHAFGLLLNFPKQPPREPTILARSPSGTVGGTSAWIPRSMRHSSTP